MKCRNALRVESSRQSTLTDLSNWNSQLHFVLMRTLETIVFGFCYSHFIEKRSNPSQVIVVLKVIGTAVENPCHSIVLIDVDVVSKPLTCRLHACNRNVWSELIHAKFPFWREQSVQFLSEPLITCHQNDGVIKLSAVDLYGYFRIYKKHSVSVLSVHMTNLYCCQTCFMPVECNTRT